MGLKFAQVSLILTMLYAGIVFFVHLGALPADIMETRNFTTAREMVEYNNWFLPTMNGELRIAKPPLPTWLTAVFGKVFGFNSVAVLRIPAALAGLLLVFFLNKLVRRFDREGDQAVVAGLVLASSFYAFLLARTGSWDVFCHAFMLAAIYFLHLALSKTERKENDAKVMLSAGVFMGLSFLSKGPVSFYALLLPYLLAYLLTYTPKDFLKPGKTWILLLLPVILISVSWPLYTYLNIPEQAVAIAGKESNNWLHYTTRPIWHYWSFPIQSGIWVLFLIAALLWPFMRKRLQTTETFVKSDYKFFFLWTVLAVVLLSLIPEKKERYLFPVLIPAAGLISYYFRVLRDYDGSEMIDKVLYYLNAVLLTLIAFLLPIAFAYFKMDGIDFGLARTILCFFVFWGIALALIFQVRNGLKHAIVYVAAGIFFMAVLFLMPVVYSQIDQNSGVQKLEEIRGHELYAPLPIYTSTHDLRIEMVWAAGKRVHFIDEDELSEIQKPALLLRNVKEGWSSIAQRSRPERIGRFDHNRYPDGHRKHSTTLDQELFLVQ